MIDILLSTYNGARFLEEQLNSILVQTEQNWHLIIRDDGSSDSTMDIIRSYRSQYPKRITITTDNDAHLGPSQSFHRLMRESDAPYIMFCDQDDVWMPRKTEIMLKKIRNIENKASNPSRVLLHCDLQVVDSELKILHPSLMKTNKLHPETKGLIPLSIRNNVTGCAMMCNKALLDLALPMPEAAIMHDWWIALTAAALGEIHYIPEPLVLYRQHSQNYYGTGAWRKTIAHCRNMKQNQKNIHRISKQTFAVKKAYGDEISNPLEKEFLFEFGDLHNWTFFEKRKIILKYRRQYNSTRQILIMLLLA